MPGREGVRLVGGAQLRSTMKRAGQDMTELKALNKRAGDIVAPVARVGTPVGPGVNGHISSTVRVGATQKAAIIRAGGARYPYANPIHWGWHRRNIRPNPWVSRAAQVTEPRWVPVYEQGLGQIISKIRGA